MQFAIERSDRYGQEPHYANRWPMPDDSVIAQVDELLSEPPAKLLVRHPSWHADELLTDVPPAIPAAIFKRLTARGHGSRERRDPATLAELWSVCEGSHPGAT